MILFKEQNGHFVLRTPVRHCELNPIELVWAMVKSAVSKRNTSFRIREVEKLVHEELKQGHRSWLASRTAHVVQIEEKMRHIEGIIDVEPIIFTLSDSSSDESSSDEDDNSS